MINPVSEYTRQEIKVQLLEMQLKNVDHLYSVNKAKGNHDAINMLERYQEKLEIEQVKELARLEEIGQYFDNMQNEMV